MKSLLEQIEEGFYELEETLENNDELEEISTSAGAGSYMPPNAFGKKVTKYPSVPLIYTPSQTSKITEAMDAKYEQLIEGYRSFASGNSKISPEQRVNQSIKEVAHKLKEIEETIRYTSRLKTESGIAHGGLKESSKNALNKISERLIKISERIRSLGE